MASPNNNHPLLLASSSSIVGPPEQPPWKETLNPVHWILRLTANHYQLILRAPIAFFAKSWHLPACRFAHSSLLVGLPPWERPSLYQACGITSLLGKSACDQINSPRFGLALHGAILSLGYQIFRIWPIPPLPYQSNHFDQSGLPTLRRARLSRFPTLISEGKFHSSPLHISL